MQGTKKIVKSEKKYNNLEEIRGVESFINSNGENINKIESYKFEIFIKDKKPLKGVLSREDMDLICRLYSREGSNLSQRDVSRYFPQYNIEEIKRILSAYNITKAGVPFAPHMLEELSVSELAKLSLNAKKNDYYKLAESEEIKNNKELAKKYIKNEYQLDKLKEDIHNNFKKGINLDKLPKFKSNFKIESNNDLMLHFADFHIGAYVGESSEFNNNWDEKELYKRLTSLLNSIYSLGINFNNIVINVLGDMMDGFYGQTTRRDHHLAQNMANTEQIRVYKESMIWFIKELFKSKISNNLKLYSVNGGNHDGFAMGETTKLIFLTSKMMFPDYIDNVDINNIPVSDKFYLDYEFKGRKFLLTHGKDDSFMKRPLPSILNPNIKDMLNDVLINRGMYNDLKPIHIIKGDMHNDVLDSSLRYDYRTCLSLFGSSDYCQSNYSANKSGVSYELFIGNSLSRGVFDNLK